jgi:predicted GIY-YIG superfamily endonuclease
MSHRPNDEPTALYRLYDANDALLYLGITQDPNQRWAQHRRRQHWWLEVARKEVVWIGCRAQAEATEAEALLVEKPRYDRHLSGIYRNDPPSTVRQHADPEAERKIQAALTAMGSDIRSGEFPPWTVMPEFGRLSDRYRLPIMAIDVALKRLDFQENLVTRLDSRSVVADPRTFPNRYARGWRLTHLLAQHHFGQVVFTAVEVSERTGLASATVTQHIKRLRLEGLAVAAGRKGTYALASS